MLTLLMQFLRSDNLRLASPEEPAYLFIFQPLTFNCCGGVASVEGAEHCKNIKLLEEHVSQLASCILPLMPLLEVTRLKESILHFIILV